MDGQRLPAKLRAAAVSPEGDRQSDIRRRRNRVAT